MNKEVRLAFAGALSLVFIAAVCAIPPTAHNFTPSSVSMIEQDPPQTQSASGIISAVDKSSFSLTLALSGHVKAGENLLQQDPPKSMTFVIDKNTTIEGKLQVGSNADVTYRDDTGGNHLAIGVRVTPPQI
jgi:hypothetical protein